MDGKLEGPKLEAKGAEARKCGPVESAVERDREA